MTKLLMSLVMPGEILFMHKDLPPRPWDGADWAAGTVSFPNSKLTLPSSPLH